MSFQNPPYMASRQLLIPRIAYAGTSFSPLPCHAWRGYMVTCAYRVEVEVGDEGRASAPHSGAAAAAPPAGAECGNYCSCVKFLTSEERRHTLQMGVSIDVHGR
jgi:hypothetical protein